METIIDLDEKFTELVGVYIKKLDTYKEKTDLSDEDVEERDDIGRDFLSIKAAYDFYRLLQSQQKFHFAYGFAVWFLMSFRDEVLFQQEMLEGQRVN